MLAQSASHSPAGSQQSASTAQTASQQASSSQPGEPLSRQQLPTPGQVQSVPQIPSAFPTQAVSQPLAGSQQPGSSVHTRSQQVGSLHPSVACVWQQSSWPGQEHNGPQRASAMTTQGESHPVAESQQLASCVQTISQQVASIQPSEPVAWQQSPVPGQTFRTQKGSHSVSASLAHSASHPLIKPQQDGSDAQTVSQQVRSSQPGEPFCSQQSPMPGHASAIQ